MNDNIEIVVVPDEKDGMRCKLTYKLVSTDDLHLPSYVFNTLEDAELAVAMAKALKKAHGDDYWIEMGPATKYMFRVLGINNEWI